ncbi:MAG: tetratricopeptide repeat protein [Chitinophagaceae bacterium]|jgi:tetratricopeptide (TPR) repeat protein|nr:tetratricopeptide repeat protein [Chitinophagaceae bacterium]
MIRVIFLTLILFTSSVILAQVDSAGFYFQKGLEEKQKGRLMESFKHFDRAYSYNSKSKEIVNELASTYFDLRKYGQARVKYKEAEQLGEVSAEGYKKLMTLSFNLRQYDDAILYANKLKNADQSEKVNYYIGKAHYDRENYGEAIRFLNEASIEDPQNSEIPYLVARSYADMMNFKLAVPYFEKAIQLSPDKPSWIYETGLIYYAMHDDKNALKYILLAGEKGHARDNDYLENLGIAYLNLGDLDKGLEIMQEVLTRRPSDMNVLNMVAEAYYNAKKYKEAMEYWDRILGYDKGNASALYMIGMCYQKMGEKEKGIALCDKAIEMDPSLAALKQKKQMPGM